MRRKNLARVACKKQIYLATEGAAGTEWHYINKLCRDNNCGLNAIKGLSKNEADPVKLATAAVKFAKTAEDNKFCFEIWVMFDNDCPAKVREAFNMVHRHNARRNPKVQIAFNSPLVEVWGILCVDPSRHISTNPARCKSDLKDLMPGYDHEHNRYFNLELMSKGTIDALVRAKKMEQSAKLCEAEYDMCPHAGIYKLVKSIIE